MTTKPPEPGHLFYRRGRQAHFIRGVFGSAGPDRFYIVADGGSMHLIEEQAGRWVEVLSAAAERDRAGE